MEEDKINFQKAGSRLSARKEELFNSGIVSKWELSIEDQNTKFDFLKDKSLILSKMLPQVIKLLDANMNNCLTFQYITFF